ncbi:acetate/propionate family kinase [Buchnera aphidicola]|uniref:Acetate kinase n=1 Tax=Buchnera aphidicola subsp. Tuberolachnus salignus TaxID=98804 RepID=A0A160SY23_BUCTT|nr:acetate/propionate family kinase [Buchnera aphidicola]CUR53104.1 Acetate kinase [Buchnera aphidicola (Tuberolachnus salignus)]
MEKKVILVLNCGSSTIKFSIINFKKKIFLKGVIDYLKTSKVCAMWTHLNFSKEIFYFKKKITYKIGLKFIFNLLKNQFKKYYNNIIGVGHRVVHGGEEIKKTSLITKEILIKIKKSSIYAPLHNPNNLLGIKNSLKYLPHLSDKNVAIFDTTFHSTIPKIAFLYAIPYFFYKKHKIRRYGAHGINYLYITQKSAVLLNKNIYSTNLIICHLGNGASITAIVKGKSADTSMGLTPLEGLVMGTRCGDLDPSIIFYLYEILKIPIKKIKKILMKKSGLLGLSEINSDFRILEKQYKDNIQTEISIKIFCYRLSKYIASYFVPLNGKIDALIFTGGIGENSGLIRKKIIKKIQFLGFKLDKIKNINNNFQKNSSIHQEKSIPIFVIAADEEKMIASETFKILKNCEQK